MLDRKALILLVDLGVGVVTLIFFVLFGVSLWGLLFCCSCVGLFFRIFVLEFG